MRCSAVIGVLFRGDFHVMPLVGTDGYIGLVAFTARVAIVTQFSLCWEVVVAEMVDFILAFAYEHIDGT
jgi:hypothetical protein